MQRTLLQDFSGAWITPGLHGLYQQIEQRSIGQAYSACGEGTAKWSDQYWQLNPDTLKTKG